MKRSIIPLRKLGGLIPVSITPGLGVAQQLLMRGVAQRDADSFRVALDRLREAFPEHEDDVLIAALGECQEASIHQLGTTYHIGDVVIPASRNGHRYICIEEGQTNTSEIEWPTGYRARVKDCKCLWQEYGTDMAELFDVPAAMNLIKSGSLNVLEDDDDVETDDDAEDENDGTDTPEGNDDNANAETGNGDSVTNDETPNTQATDETKATLGPDEIKAVLSPDQTTAQAKPAEVKGKGLTGFKGFGRKKR